MSEPLLEVPLALHPDLTGVIGSGEVPQVVTSMSGDKPAAHLPAGAAHFTQDDLSQLKNAVSKTSC